MFITPQKSKLKNLHINFCLSKQEVFRKLPVQKDGCWLSPWSKVSQTQTTISGGAFNLSMLTEIFELKAILRKIFNPYAAGGLFGRYKIIQNPEKWSKPWQMGTQMRVLGESYPMNTNMTGLAWFLKILASLYLGLK